MAPTLARLSQATTKPTLDSSKLKGPRITKHAGGFPYAVARPSKEAPGDRYRLSNLSHEANLQRSSVVRSAMASFWRGGTSKGIFIAQNILPNFLYPTDLMHRQKRSAVRWEDHSERLEGFLCSMLGSPDPFGRQLDGLGKVFSQNPALLW